MVNSFVFYQRMVFKGNLGFRLGKNELCIENVIVELNWKLLFMNVFPEAEFQSPVICIKMLISNDIFLLFVVIRYVLF